MEILKQELTIRGYSKETIKAYEFHNNAFLKLLGKSSRKVTRQDLKEYIFYLIEKGYERSTINLVIASLNFYYNKILSRTFVVKRLRSQKKLFPVLSIGEIKRLFSSVKNEKHLMVLKFFYFSGVRLSELINLKVKDIDFEREQIHIISGKGRKDRFINLRKIFESELKEYLKNKDLNEYLFLGKNGKYSKRTIQKICSVYTKKAGIIKNVTPHTLRRTFATHLIENKNDIYKVSKLMGHANTSTTEGYISYAKIDLTADL